MIDKFKTVMKSIITPFVKRYSNNNGKRMFSLNENWKNPSSFEKMYAPLGIAVTVGGASIGILNYLISVQILPIKLEFEGLKKQQEKQIDGLKNQQEKQIDGLKNQQEKQIDTIHKELESFKNQQERQNESVRNLQEKSLDETHKVLVEVQKSNERIAKLESKSL